MNAASAPLGLNLSKFSNFNLNFAGLITEIELLVTIVVWFHLSSFEAI